MEWGGFLISSGWTPGEEVWVIPCKASYDDFDLANCDYEDRKPKIIDDDGFVPNYYFGPQDVRMFWGAKGWGHGNCILYSNRGPDGEFWSGDEKEVVLCDSGTGEPPARPEAPDMAAPREYDFSATDEFMQGFVDQRGLNGATVIVVDRDDGIVHRANFGEFGPGRISLLGNISETFSVGILMSLYDDGLLDIDAPISDAVSWGTGMPDVTVAQLLSHSSGMLGGPASSWYAPYQCANSYTDSLQECGEEIVNTPDDDADLVPPDTEFRWPATGADAQVAGAIAEAVSGKSWAELVDETWVRPCGMDTLAYKNPWNEFTLDPVTWGYLSEFAGDPSTLSTTDNPSIQGGAYATADDLAALVLMHLRNGMCGDQQVLSAEAIDLMTEDRIARVYDGTNVDFFGNAWGFGMGWTTNRATGWTGNGGIWASGITIDRDAGFGAVVLLEATFQESQALGSSEVFSDSVRDAVMAARG